MDIKKYIREIPDFPEKGIGFKDITPLLQNPEAFSYVVDTMCQSLQDADVIVGLDARGFLFAGAVAYKLKKPLVIIRKTGKLPFTTLTEKYTLEYGEASFDIHTDAILPGQKVAIIDDVLATGGTMLAAKKLVEKLGGEVISLTFLMHLSFISTHKELETATINSIITY